MERDFDVVKDTYTIDAKSIMGIFSLDFSRPLQLNYQNVSAAEEEILRKYECL